MQTNILEIRDLKAYFYAGSGIVKAVDGVRFAVEKGKVFGLVGESGSGKTLTALSILRLIAPPGRIVGGSVLFNGADLLNMEEESIRLIRGQKIAIVFQESSSALNPVFTVGYQISEAIIAHQKADKIKARDMALDLLDRVHIQDPKKIFGDYPHQLSGGTKQRIGIAMALANSPEVLILDEPTTALDVTIQAGILDLLDEIIKKEALSILFISHDFGIIARMADSVGVMYKGKIVEMGEKDRILNSPKEAYTISLLEAVRKLA